MSKETFYIGEHKVTIDSSLLKFNDQTLSKYIEQEGAWYDNIGHSLSMAERHLGLLEAKHEKFFSERFAEFKEGGGSDKLCDAKAKSDFDVASLKEQIADAKYRVSRLKQHLKAWDKNHDNAQSMGHMQRKQMDKMHGTISESPEPREPREEKRVGMEEGTSMDALNW
jgi:hypothetical protein